MADECVAGSAAAPCGECYYLNYYIDCAFAEMEFAICLRTFVLVWFSGKFM